GGYNEGATYTSQGGNDYTISYLSGNVTLTAIVNAVAVPEPATCAVLAGLAMLMLAAARRGQRKRGQRG
ncbi:MAG: PEP-CTERM sorting domain-containing protein, partial [Opitutaceae bacterium]|nr:PEP-CTERM sorting domain-containing protein [Opitutaceae bacterium]